MAQLKLDVKPAKSVREHVREKLADLHLRQKARRGRRPGQRRPRAAGPVQLPLI
jgi:hypothetical protein